MADIELKTNSMEFQRIIASKDDTITKLTLITKFFQLKEEFDINFQDCESQNSALHIAVEINDKHLLQYLLGIGVCVSLKNKEGQTAKELAINRERSKSLINLLEKNELYESPKWGKVIHFDFLNPIEWRLVKAEKVAAIVVNNCNDTVTALAFLEKNDSFCDFINNSSHLFIIIIHIGSPLEAQECILSTFQSKITDSRPIIVQFQTHDISKSVIYYREPFKSFVPCGDKKAESFEYLQNSQIFNLDILIAMLRASFGGKYSGDLLQCSLDTSICFDLWRFVDYAAYYSDSLSMRLLFLLAEWDLTSLNDDRRLLEIACEFGDEHTVSAILNLSLKSDSHHRDTLNEEQRQLLHLKDNCGNTPFCLAVVKGKIGTVDLLINLGCGNEDKCQSAVDQLWANRNGDKLVVLKLVALLEKDAPFPSKFDVDFKHFKHDALEEIVNVRNIFHQAIKENNEENVSAFIKSHPHIKNGFNTKNKVALHTALEFKRFRVYAVLRANGFSEDESVATLLECLRRDEQFEIKHENELLYRRMNASHILHLVSKSRLAFEVEDLQFSHKIRKFYETLDEIPRISQVLKIIEHSDTLTITFDFSNDSVVNMDPTQNAETSGSCDFKGGRIYIGGKKRNDRKVLGGKKRNDRKVLGTLAHELTHLAMQTRYKNNCDPYGAHEEKKEESFRGVIDELRKHQNDLDVTFKNVFTVYDHCEIPAELIVRINQILARYPVESGEILEKVRCLVDWYDANVVPDFNEFIKNSAEFKIESKIHDINTRNELFMLVSNLASNVEFKSCVFFDSCIFSTDSLFLIPSSASVLDLINLYQMISSPPISLKKNVLITSSENLENEQVCTEIIYLMYNSPKTKLIIDCTSSRIPDINYFPFKHNIIAIIRQDQLSHFKSNLYNVKVEPIIEISYRWSDLTDKSKHYLLKRDVIFQESFLKLENILTLDSKALDSLPLALFVKNELFKIGDKISGNSTCFQSEFHMERFLNRTVNVKKDVFDIYTEDIFITDYTKYKEFCNAFKNKNVHLLIYENDRWVWKQSSRNMSLIMQYIHHDAKSRYAIEPELLLNNGTSEKFIILSDSAGMGKSAFVVHTAKAIKSRYPNNWVLIITLNELEQYWKDIQFPCLEDAVHFLTNNMLQLTSEFDKNLFKESCLNPSKIKIILFFDGFDEIGSECRCTVLNLLEQLRQSAIEQIWITTRQHLGEQLENHLSTIRYTLNPFCREEQIQFLTKFWLKYCPVDSTKEKIAREYAEELLMQISRRLRHRGDEIIEIPLQTRLVAEVFEKHFQNLENEAFKVPEISKISQLYELFIEKRYEIYIREKTGISHFNEAMNFQFKLFFERTGKFHQKLGMMILYEEARINEIRIRKLFDQFQLEDISRIGLISVNGSFIVFINRTFTEFFGAQFFVKNIIKNKTFSSDIQHFFLSVILSHPEHRVVRLFINEMLDEKFVKSSMEWERRNDFFFYTEAVKISIRENNKNILNFILSVVKTSEEKEILIQILESPRSWDDKYIETDILEVIYFYARDIKIQVGSFISALFRTWSTAAQRGNESTLKLIYTWCLELNMTYLDLRQFLQYAWIVSTTLENFQISTLILKWSMEKPNVAPEDAKKLLMHERSWQEAIRVNLQNVLQKFRHWDDNLSLTDQELRTMMFNGYLWSSAASIGQSDILEMFWSWCQEASFTKDDSAIILSNSHLWRSAASNGKITALKLLWKYSNDIELELHRRTHILLSNETWAVRHPEWKQILRELLIQSKLSSNEFEILVRCVLNNTSENVDILGQLRCLGDQILETNQELYLIILRAWREAPFHRTSHSLIFLGQWMKLRNFTESEIKSILIDPITWELVLVEKCIVIERLLWGRCTQVQISVKDYENLLRMKWHWSAVSGDVIMFRKLVCFLFQKCGVILHSSGNAENYQIIVKHLKLKSQSSLYSMFKQSEWAKLTKPVVDNYIRSLSTTKAITEGDKESSILCDRYSHFDWTCKWMLDIKGKLRENLERTSDGKEKWLMKKIRRCGNAMKLSEKFLKQLLTQRETWTATAFMGQTEILCLLFKSLIDCAISTELIMESAMQGALNASNVELFESLLSISKYFGSQPDNIPSIFENAWFHSIKLGGANDILWKYKDKISGRTISDSLLLTNIDAWRHACKHGFEGQLSNFWKWKNSHEISVFSRILQDETIWREAASNGNGRILKMLWHWAHEAMLSNEIFRNIILESWKSAIIGGHCEILDIIWKWGKRYKMDHDRFYHIFYERLDDGKNVWNAI